MSTPISAPGADSGISATVPARPLTQIEALREALLLVRSLHGLATNLGATFTHTFHRKEEAIRRAYERAMLCEVCGQRKPEP